MRATCSVPTCTRERGKKSHMCGGHRMRWQRDGDVRAHIPLKTYRPKGSGSVNNRGYVMDYNPTHPLAMRGGRVLRNRAVLYDSLGPGAHPCHWCSKEVSWEGDLQADHLDGDHANNSPGNLVPSCPSCNAARGNYGNPTDWSAA